MTKAWDDRISETYTFLRAYSVGSNAQYARQLVEHLQHQANNAHNLQAISNAMAQGGGSSNTTAKDNRKKRRSIIFIRCLMHNHVPAVASSAVSSIPDTMLDSQLNYEIGLARNNVIQALNTAFAQLTNNTATFLQNNSIWVRSNTSRGVQTFQLSHDPTQSRYRIEPLGITPQFFGTTVQINHIPVTRYSTVQNTLGQIDGVDLDVNHVALTTQLTGCSYMYEINGNAMQAAHLWPASDIAPMTLTTTLRNAPAAFQNGSAGGEVIFGAAVGNTTTGYIHTGTWTYLVAVYAGGWQLHAQQVPQGKSAPITYTRVV
ncbi:MAG: hypothetical protein U0359_22070 [Byssovorax sp.]